MFYFFLFILKKYLLSNVEDKMVRRITKKILDAIYESIVLNLMDALEEALSIGVDVAKELAPYTEQDLKGSFRLHGKLNRKSQ